MCRNLGVAKPIPARKQARAEAIAAVFADPHQAERVRASLSAPASVAGLSAEEVLDTLVGFAKYPVADVVADTVTDLMGRYGGAGRISTSDTLRFVRETINNAHFVIGDDLDRVAFFARPSTAGDQRWDALLAGVVDLLARQHQFDPPSWTTGRFVTPFWFVGSTPSLHAYAYAHSPAALANRGVFIDPADLESV